MEENTLLVIRKQIVDMLLPLAVEGNGDPGERFDMIMAIIRSGSANEEMYRTAVKIASGMDNDQKQSALMELLTEVEIDIERQAVPVERDVSQNETQSAMEPSASPEVPIDNQQ